MSAAVVGYELDDSGVVGREKPGDEHTHTRARAHRIGDCVVVSSRSSPFAHQYFDGV
jgi:hypothetical protein